MNRSINFDFLFKEVSPSSLGIFRILYSIIMLWQVQRLYVYVTEILPQSKFFISYDFFHWVKILPPLQMKLIFAVIVLASIFVGLGLFFRASVFTIFICWTYIFLICRGHYNNHYYLFCLMPLLFLFTNADRWASLRNLFSKSKAPYRIPYWQILIFKLQLFIVYFYGGLAKLNIDWLEGYPMRIWLHQRANIYNAAWLDTEWAAYLFSYGGLFFDLFIGFFLFSKRWRRWALIPVAFFHLTNHFFWNIGTFPWFMLGATLLFFEPDLPERLFNRFKQRNQPSEQKPKRRARERKQNKEQDKTVFKSLVPQKGSFAYKATIALFCTYFAFQFLFPFRHWTYKGNPSWHGQGNLFSWRMLLIDRAHAYKVKVSIPGKGIIGYVQMEEYVNHRQFYKMCRTPKSFARFARFIKNEMIENASPDVKAEVQKAEINVLLWKEINLRPYQLAIDSTMNLADIPYPLVKSASWLLPMEEMPRKSEELYILSEEDMQNMQIR